MSDKLIAELATLLTSMPDFQVGSPFDTDNQGDPVIEVKPLRADDNSRNVQLYYALERIAEIAYALKVEASPCSLCKERPARKTVAFLGKSIAACDRCADSAERYERERNHER